MAQGPDSKGAKDASGASDAGGASDAAAAGPAPHDPRATPPLQPQRPAEAIDASTRRLLPWLVAVAFFMQTLDATIVNTALPAMAHSLGESPLQMQSVVVAYMLTVALLIPASGWLSDIYGTRRVFSAAIVLFTIGSLLCAASSTLWQLVGSRVVQGIGGSLLMPVGRLAILRSFDKSGRLQALTFVSLPGLVGPLIGPTLGGWLVEIASWHWIFLINLPVGLVGLLAARRWMPDFRSTGAPPRFDLAGFVLFSLGLVTVSLGLQGFGEGAISIASALVLLVAGLAAMVAYWLRAARVEWPLFSLDLFQIPTFAIGLAGNLFSRLGSGAMPFLTPLFLQVALGVPPAQAGMSMVPTALGAMLCKSFAVPLINHFGYRRVLVINTVLLGSAIAGFALIDAGTPRPLMLLLLFCFGIVNSLQFTAMNTLTLGDLDERRASSGNSLLSVAMQLSMSLGVAVGGALLAAFAGGHRPQMGSPEVLHAFHATYLCVGLMSILAAAVFLQLGRKEAPCGSPNVTDAS